MPNFVADFLDRQPAEQPALVTIGADGARREWSFGELSQGARSASALLADRGVRRGDVVATMTGSRIEWALTLLGCLRLGAVAAPLSPMLREGDLRIRAQTRTPTLIVADDEHLDLLTAAGLTDLLPVSQFVLDPSATPPAAPDLAPTDPAFLLFTSGSTGTPKPVWHGQRYVWGQVLQGRHWLGAGPGDVVWSTAAPGWSKSTRNAFIAPWLCGARAILYDGRFDPAERLAIAAAEEVTVLCMAPTEWRRVVQVEQLAPPPSLRRLVAAGEPLDPETIGRWRTATGLTIADGYGQTETGHLAASTVEDPARPGSVGRPLPGIRVRLVDGELQVDASTVPTLCLVTDDDLVDGRWWRTGDLFDEDADGFLHFRARVDDVILSSGYRIDPAEVEKALGSHPAVIECIVAGIPDPSRGEAVAALVVLRDGAGRDAATVAELQDHVRSVTAPYKYPRVVRFVDELPRTTTGKPARGEGRTLLEG